MGKRILGLLLVISLFMLGLCLYGIKTNQPELVKDAIKIEEEAIETLGIAAPCIQAMQEVF